VNTGCNLISCSGHDDEPAEMVLDESSHFLDFIWFSSRIVESVDVRIYEGKPRDERLHKLQEGPDSI
jgi:hypothetical protein